MKKFHLKLESKYIIGIFTIGIISFITLGFIIYSQVSRMLIKQCEEDAMGLAQVAAKQMDGDLFPLLDDVDSVQYQEQYDVLDKYSDNKLITYIYAMKPVDNHLEFVIDTDKEEPSELGEYYELLEDMIPALNGETCCDQELSSDRWGTYFSAYSPIFNSANEVVGFVGCDISITDIEVMLQRLRLLIVVFLSIFAIALVMSYINFSEELMMRDTITEIPKVSRLYKIADKHYKNGTLRNYTGIHFNIKNFRYINQQVGTDSGDVILREYAKFITGKTGKKELVVSMGGDAFFALILNDNVDKFTKEIAPKDMKYALPANSISEEMELIINIRCGICPAGDNNIRETMHMCSLALTEAKKSNDDIVSFNSSMLDSINTEKDVFLAFSDAIKNEEFVVFYQPKVNSATNELEGAEALCRWVRKGSIVPPNNFIPLLEESGLITELDFYMLEHVCQDIRSWIKRGIKPVRISTNFSKQHFKNTDFTKNVIDIINKYEIPVEYIETELTESTGYSDNETLKDFLRDMKKENICTSMDDFGTGYSSLSLLKELDFDVVKIDRSFFKDMYDNDRKNLKVIEHVIHMIHDLDREVVCEGIETDDQVDFLRTVGNPLIQGYLFDKPLPQAMFEKRLINPKYSDNLNL